MNETFFTNTIISWYNKNKRTLPWRNTTDPYPIWLSEIILQQTRVNQGLNYFETFLENFPTIFNLATASEEKVLRLWQGLGYYSRARNLHATAKFITENLDGIFPSSYEEIIKLKGVGEYTAAAIASFAFNEKVAVLDGNVYRVLSRYFGITNDISDSKSKKVFLQLANEILPNQNVNSYNQGIMEFGALHCKPQNPYCTLCPLQNSCYAFANNQQSKLPVKTKKIKVKKRYFNYLIFEHKNQFFVKKRIEKDIWQNLYDFFLIEKDKLHENIQDFFEEPIFQSLDVNKITIKKQGDTYKHILSHQHIFAQFWLIKVESENFEIENLVSLSLDEIENLPKPTLIDNHFQQFFT